MMKKILVAVLITALAACSPDAERAEFASESGPLVYVVNGLVSAFNAHDPDAMRRYWHDDVAWIELSGNESRILTSNADDLHAEMVSYFEAFPDVFSSLDRVSVNGDFVTGVEYAVWREDGERRAQSSIVVYEIVDGRVKRFWYYPAQQ